jgi:hypothetical protein
VIRPYRLVSAVNRLSACCRSLCFVKLPLGSGANFIQFRMQSPNLGIELDKAQARRANQGIGSDSRVILRPVGFQINTGGRLQGSWIGIQVHKIQTTRVHDAVIITHNSPRRSDQICTIQPCNAARGCGGMVWQLCLSPLRFCPYRLNIHAGEQERA